MSNGKFSHDGFIAFACRYAARSLWRNKRRTLLTIGTVTLSVAVSIIATRYSTAIMKIWADGSIDHGSAHAQLHTPAFYEHPDVVTEAVTMKEGQDVEERLKNDPNILAFSRRLTFEGIISSGVKSVYFLGKAVSPEAELQVSPEIFHPGADAGRFVTSEIPTGITIGRGLAETLGLKLGDEVTLMANTLSGAVNGIDAQVIGILDPPLPALSKRLVFMHIAEGQKSLGIPGRYTEVAIRLKPGVMPEQWVAGFESTAQTLGLDLRGWWKIDPIIRKVEKIWDSVVGLISFLLFMSAAISVLNIVFMLVAERTVEIGTLMAIGAKPKDIRTLFTMEAALIGGIGGLVGSLLGNAYVLGMDLIGVPFDSPFSAAKLVVHPKMSLLVTVIVAIIAVIICYVAALAPARKAAHVEPVVAFRGQIT